MIYCATCFVLLLLSFSTLRRKRGVYIFFCFWLFSLMAFRSFNVGADTANYINFFLSESGGYRELAYSVVDLQHLKIFNSFLRSLISDGTLYLMVIYSVVLIPYFKFVDKFSENKLLSLVFFFVLGVFFDTLLAMRQFLSIGFVLIAMQIFEGKKTIRSFVWSVPLLFLAFMLHFSSVYTFLLYVFCSKFEWGKRSSIVIMMVSAALGYLFCTNDSIDLFKMLALWSTSSNKMEVYSTWVTAKSMSFFDYMKLGLIPSLLFLCIDDVKCRTFFAKCFVLGTSLGLFFHSFLLVQRAVSPLLFMGTISLPSAFYNRQKKIYMYLPCIVLLYYVYVFYRGIFAFDFQNDLVKILPYSFFFEELL